MRLLGKLVAASIPSRGEPLVTFVPLLFGSGSFPEAGVGHQVGEYCLSVLCRVGCFLGHFSFLKKLKRSDRKSSPQKTPLDLMKSHFKDLQRKAKESGEQVHIGKLTAFCFLDWPSFQVGWPGEGSFNFSLIYRVQHVVFSKPGHLGGSW